MSNMFFFCSSMEEINLSGFKTNKVTNMNSMFAECLSLSEINLSMFNTSEVHDMGNMFENCAGLKVLIPKMLLTWATCLRTVIN